MHLAETQYAGWHPFPSRDKGPVWQEGNTTLPQISEEAKH